MCEVKSAQLVGHTVSESAERAREGESERQRDRAQRDICRSKACCSESICSTLRARLPQLAFRMVDGDVNALIVYVCL